jgi:hypothetical protein
MHDEDGLEQHTLRSVGIDIGSATSHFTVSRLVVRRRGSALSAEFVVSERETVFRSPIWLTPYRGGDEIDTGRLRALFEAGYRAAGIAPADLEVGAVVISGEALTKRNAEPIARMVADWSGRFVCISAGHNQEAVLAAHGSGAVALSADTGATVVNLDVGGGTTKFSVVRAGTVTHVEVIGVGARLVAYDPASRVVTRLEHAVRPLLDRLGLGLDLGDRLSTTDTARLGELMADEIVGHGHADAPAEDRPGPQRRLSRPDHRDRDAAAGLLQPGVRAAVHDDRVVALPRRLLDAVGVEHAVLGRRLRGAELVPLLHVRQVADLQLRPGPAVRQPGLVPGLVGTAGVADAGAVHDEQQSHGGLSSGTVTRRTSSATSGTVSSAATASITAAARSAPSTGSASERNLSARSASLTGLRGWPGKWMVVSSSSAPERSLMWTLAGLAPGQ